MTAGFRICKDCRNPGAYPQSAANRMGMLYVSRTTGVCKLCAQLRRRWPNGKPISTCPTCGIKVGHIRIAERLGLTRGVDGYCTQHYENKPRRRPVRGQEYLEELESGMWQSRAELARYYGVREESVDRAIERYEQWLERAA